MDKTVESGVRAIAHARVEAVVGRKIDANSAGAFHHAIDLLEKHWLAHPDQIPALSRTDSPASKDAIHNAAVEIVGRYDANDQSKRADGEDVDWERLMRHLKAADDAVKLLRTLLRQE